MALTCSVFEEMKAQSDSFPSPLCVHQWRVRMGEWGGGWQTVSLLGQPGYGSSYGHVL